MFSGPNIQKWDENYLVSIGFQETARTYWEWLHNFVFLPTIYNPFAFKILYGLSDSSPTFRSLPPPYPEIFTFFLSLKRNTHTHTQESVLCCLTTPEYLARLGVWQIYQWHSIEENCFFSPLLWKLPITNNFLIWGETLCPLLVLCAVILSGLKCSSHVHAFIVSVSSYVQHSYCI